MNKRYSQIISIMLILAGLGFLSFVIYVVATRFSLLFQTENLPAVIGYIVVPSACGIALLCTFKLKPHIKAKLLLLLISTSFSIWMADFSLGIIDECEKQNFGVLRKRALKAGVPFDTRTRAEVVRDLRQKNVRAYSLLAPSGFVGGRLPIGTENEKVLPLTAISKVTTVIGNELGYYIITETDEHGFRNPVDIWDNPQLDIVIIGDSFGHGAFVPDKDTFASRIREKYPGTLNLSMCGNGPLLELAILKEYAGSLRPRVVLWCFYIGNDLKNLNNERHDTILLKYLNSDFKQNLMQKQRQIDAALIQMHDSRLKGELESGQQIHWTKIMKKAMRKSIYLSAIRERFNVYFLYDGLANRNKQLNLGINKLSSEIHPRVQILKQVISEARDFISQWDGQLIVVFLPAWRSHPKGVEILHMLNSLDIPVIDIHKIFLNDEDSLQYYPFRTPSHLNEKGYQVVADEILYHLEENNYFAN